MRRKLGRWLSSLFVLLLAALGVSALTAEPVPDHAFLAQDRLLVTAHRGGRGLWPENTLYAFEGAVALGVDILESDVHSSSDGILVLMHDDTVDRTTDGTGRIHDHSLAELQALDAGYRWTDDEGATFPYRGQGFSVPTLQAFFERFPDHLMSLEIKQLEPSIIAPLCRMIRGFGRADRTLVGSFDGAAVKGFRRECPEVATAATQSEVATFLALSALYLESASHVQAEIFFVPDKQGPLTIVSHRFVTAAQKRNAAVNVWTVNERPDIERIAALGVDSITTDYPDRLLELIGENGSGNGE